MGKRNFLWRSYETDENGNAEVEIETSDRLSTYRIIAVAYNDDEFGTSEKKILVTKNIFIEEAMPEIAVKGDKFLAGVLVSNRFEKDVHASLYLDTSDLLVKENEKEVTLKPKSNQLINFEFQAEKSGDAELKFFITTKYENDGIYKKIPVLENLSSESIVDFEIGKDLKKRIVPLPQWEEPQLKLKISPSVISFALPLAERLVFYPYECLEQ